MGNKLISYQENKEGSAIILNWVLCIKKPIIITF
jgi:hypothetical protein